MTFKEGDVINIDGVDWEVEHASPNGYWIKPPGTSVGYYGLRFEHTNSIQEMLNKGRLRFGNGGKVTPGDGYCSFHEWKKYVGVREVYDYCTQCGAKRTKDWRMIRDEKDY